MGREAGFRFPPGFLWGAGTSAYQIEGAVSADGRSPSIWDTFTRVRGAVADGATGDVACDHYHRWEEDVALMADLGLTAYRFSIAWPRVVPEGHGRVHAAGLDFYDRLVDRLLERDFTPFVTLYHWDLPQSVEDTGGWPERDTAKAFAHFASVTAERLGDRVVHWATLNEPYVSAELGYHTGAHAPGHRSEEEALAASHHLLLAHGLGLQAVRAAAPRSSVGIVLNFEPKVPASQHPADLEAAALAHASMNRWYLDPIFGRDYPAEAVAERGWAGREVVEGDLKVIAAPIDWLGVNYYTREVVAASLGASLRVAPELPKTDMGWDIHPEGLFDVLDWIWREYPAPSFYVTENGAAFSDDPEDPLHDPLRVAFLHDHLVEAGRAITSGVPLRGYFVWSLMDNFEWTEGYRHRFGIVHVDRETLQRRPRASARYVSAVARSGMVDPPGFG